MKVVSFGLAVAALLAFGAPTASAQMVVNPNLGERVDYPFYSDDGHRLHFRHHRHVAYRYRSRFYIIESAFPTPPVFGWGDCCQ
jgi:hypothetical protein